eukprot:362355-Chlamydomonas_euryale.AAC.16
MHRGLRAGPEIGTGGVRQQQGTANWLEGCSRSVRNEAARRRNSSSSRAQQRRAQPRGLEGAAAAAAAAAAARRNSGARNNGSERVQQQQQQQCQGCSRCTAFKCATEAWNAFPV